MKAYLLSTLPSRSLSPRLSHRLPLNMSERAVAYHHGDRQLLQVGQRGEAVTCFLLVFPEVILHQSMPHHLSLSA